MRGRVSTRTVVRRALAWALAASSVCAPATARAEAPRILFVAPAGSRLSARVRAEIHALGFTIEEAGAPGGARAASAVATARVIESPPRRIELWTADASRGRLVLREVIELDGDDDWSTAAVRASEQLRAYLEPLRDPDAGRPDATGSAHDGAPAAEPAQRSTAPPFDRAPPATSAPGAAAPRDATGPRAAAPASRFSVTAAIAVPVQLGRPGLDVVLRGRWMATRVIGLGGLVALPLAPSNVDTADGLLDIRALVFGAELSALLLDAPRVGLSVSAGFGGAWLRTTGATDAGAPMAASAPTMPLLNNVVTGLPFLGFEIAPRITARVRLVLAGHLGVSTAQASIVQPGQTAGVWGRPLGLFSLGSSVDF